MSLIIRVEPRTLEFISELNGGIKPKVENPPSIFVYHGDTKPNEIITLDEAIMRFFNDPSVQPRMVEYCVFSK